ncbi:aspartate carbamoyltransferase [Candidatus Kinetoplastidibacterium crithidiae]|uniref:Aspartate carbamoyltransferase n=1 Tax=Candidatus Kinetoplastidibacterium crithidiae TCC036E TaxID=1208918 RepID=M1LTR3_9PROT|nr:aspartate carbamoyltransferase [Candidatus Kinetoplastibacterium crithidii]AGF47496.1 aspartate carbamoyltransferase catalytic subunit [Candidatus Kinetoplastibacterium crithidii TCC036E]
MSQQMLLQEMMDKFGFKKENLAAYLGVNGKILNSWFASSLSTEYTPMPNGVFNYISEFIEKNSLSGVYNLPLRNKISFFGKNHLLSVEQFDRDSIEEVFSIADLMVPIARRKKISRVLEGAVLGNLFFEASTRTRVSFGTAFCRLGGSVCDTTGFTFSSMAKGESIYDTSRVIAGYVDIMVVRHPDRGSVSEFARASNIPIINGGDGPGEHPSQALLDLYTIKNEFSRLNKSLDGAHISLIGDLKYGRTVHSLIKLLSLYKNLKISLVSPIGLEMPESIINYASRNGNIVSVESSVKKGLSGADVVYATRVQKERFESEFEFRYESDFHINSEKINAFCNKDTIIMHPLPRDSNVGSNDLSTDLNNDDRLAIFRQSDNGIPVRMAIFAILLGVENIVHRNLRDVEWSRPVYISFADAAFHNL